MMKFFEAGCLPLKDGIEVLDERINSYEMMRGICWGGKLWDTGVQTVFERIRQRLEGIHKRITESENPNKELAQRFVSDANLCVRALECPGGSSYFAAQVKVLRQDVDAKMNGGMIDVSLMVPKQSDEELVQYVAQRIKFLNSVKVLCAYDPESRQVYADHQIKYDTVKDELVPYSTSWRSLFSPPPLSVTVPKVSACVQQLLEERKQLSSIGGELLTTGATDADLLVYSLRGVQRMCSTYMIHWVVNEPWLKMMRISECATDKLGDQKLSEQFLGETKKQLDIFHAGLGDLYALSREAKGIIDSGETPH